MKQQYEVHTKCPDHGWISFWFKVERNGHQVPVKYKSVEQAQLEISETVHYLAFGINEGEIEPQEARSTQDFRIYDCANQQYLNQRKDH